MMARWSGVLNVGLHVGCSTYYRVAASLLLTPSSKSFAVPSGNAIFFLGDRVEGTNNPVIERLSDPQKTVEVLVSKFGKSFNAYVVEASIFSGPFAVYKDFIPSVNEHGEPASYDPTGFPASTSLALLLSRFLAEAKNIISGKENAPYIAEASASFSYKPAVTLLGFSKGGTVLNQLLTEFSRTEIQSISSSIEGNKSPANETLVLGEDDLIIPTSKESLFDSINEIHYVDVGLNTKGAYLTDEETINRIVKNLNRRAFAVRFMFHGTPRQWCDNRRPWIRKEKDTLVRLLSKASQADHVSQVRLCERSYFPGKLPDLQQHFEVIEVLDVT